MLWDLSHRPGPRDASCLPLPTGAMLLAQGQGWDQTGFSCGRCQAGAKGRTVTTPASPKKQNKTGEVGTRPLREAKGNEEVPRVLGSASGHTATR